MKPALTSRAILECSFLLGASVITGGALWQLGAFGMQCIVASIAIGPLLVGGFHLSLRPLVFCEERSWRCSPYIAMVGAIGFPALAGAILLWNFCAPTIAVTLLVLGPAIAFGQSLEPIGE